MRWKLATGILSSDESIAWADTVTLQVHRDFQTQLFFVCRPLVVTCIISGDHELDRMLGNGEVVRKPETSWDAMLDHGNEPFGERPPHPCVYTHISQTFSSRPFVVFTFSHTEGRCSR
jgi:hypothetical protein